MSASAPAPAPALSLEVRHHPGHTHVRLKGCDSLNDQNIEAVSRQLAPLVEGLHRPQFRLDLGEIHYVTSVALGQFISLHRKLRSAGSCLVLCNVSPFVQEALAVTRLDQLMKVLPTNDPHA